MIQHAVQTPIGALVLTAEAGALTAARFINDGFEGYRTAGLEPLFAEAEAWLEAYFTKRQLPPLPALVPAGTPFQQRVWQALHGIPYGQTRSYAAFTRTLGDPLAIRAVASANGANPLMIFTPCHRVIGTSGELTGYAGGLERKSWLLRHEGAIAAELF